MLSMYRINYLKLYTACNVHCTTNSSYNSISWKVRKLTINVNRAVGRSSSFIKLLGERCDSLTQNQLLVVISSKNLNKTHFLKKKNANANKRITEYFSVRILHQKVIAVNTLTLN